MSTWPSGGAYDGTWPPPGPSRRERSLWWRLGNSLWLLLPLVGFGCLGGAAFVVLGVVARRRLWWISGLVYLAVGIAGFVLVDDPDESTTVGNWSLGGLMAVWIASIVHGLLINGEWLNHLAGRRAARAGPAADRPAADRPAAAPTASWAPGPREYYEAAPVATPVSTAASPPPVSPSPTTAATPVDVNTATSEQLTALGIDPDGRGGRWPSGRPAAGSAASRSSRRRPSWRRTSSSTSER